MWRLRWAVFSMTMIAICGALGSCDDSTTDDSAEVATSSSSSSSTLPSGGVGLSGEPLPADLSRWANEFFTVAGRLSSVGEGAPGEQDDRCRERAGTMPATRNALENPPDNALEDLQDQYVNALDAYYRACAEDGSTDETARLLRETTDAGTKIYDRLRELGVPASTG